jgi:hypothetical protein
VKELHDALLLSQEALDLPEARPVEVRSIRLTGEGYSP